MSVLDLVREDLRDFAGYASARRASVTGNIWLNANESPWPNNADNGMKLNRYPEPQPHALVQRLSELYGVVVSRLMITRGSDEGIDLLLRTFCKAGQDGILIAPPTFGMYAVCARVQNAKVFEIPLIDQSEQWQYDLASALRIIKQEPIKLVFVCTPANPTGQNISLDDIRQLATACKNRAIVVVDEAYAEFNSEASAISLLSEFENILVLRTLSKAYAMAAARIGIVIARENIIQVLRNICAPYPVPTPCALQALAGLSDENIIEAKQRASVSISERENIFSSLKKMKAVKKVYASQGNYLLARFFDAEVAFQACLSSGVVVRDMRANPVLSDALRISVGTPDENSAML
ncbi:MAG: histidinol-phosphate transaminase, partial [Arenimonas sp.]